MCVQEYTTPEAYDHEPKHKQERWVLTRKNKKKEKKIPVQIYRKVNGYQKVGTDRSSKMKMWIQETQLTEWSMSKQKLNRKLCETEHTYN